MKLSGAQSGNKPTSGSCPSVTKLVRLSIRLHWLFLLPLIVIQYSFGSYNKEISATFGGDKKVLVNYHKLLGEVLMYMGFLLIVERVYIAVTGMVRKKYGNLIARLLIQWHWVTLGVLFIVQYVTIYYRQFVMDITGFEKGTVYRIHGYSALVILVDALVLVAIRLCNCSNSGVVKAGHAS